MAATLRIASCSCGALTARCRGAPELVSLCHCRACQRRTGAPFGIAAFYAEAAVETGGRARIYRRLSDTGFEVAFHFCPDCGATVWWRAARMAGMVAVAVGAFADPGFPAPDKEVFAESRHGWLPPPGPAAG